MNLWLSINQAITLWPDKEALVDGDKRFTYKQFAQRVASLAKRLKELGLKRGSSVAISSPNTHEYMEVYFACAISGIILVPLNYRLASEELVDIIADSDAELFFCHTEFWKQGFELLPHSLGLRHVVWIGDKHMRTPDTHRQCEQHDYEDLLQKECSFAELDLPHMGADDLAQLYYTSGTTGRPKGVMLSHGNVAVNALAAVAELKFTDKDTWIHAAPLFHLADAWSVFAITWVGGKHVFVPHFNSQHVLKVISQEQVTSTVLVPTMLNAILNDPIVEKYEYPALRLIITGGSPIAPEMVKKVMRTFTCEYVQIYGMTETSPFLTMSIPKKDHLNLPEDKQIEIRSRTGRPYLGAEVKVVHPDGKEVLWNNKDVGEIIARGPTVTRGYWKQPEATAHTIKNNWIHTGDLAVVDEHGYINIVDRKKDMIITGGENVFSTEVEYALYEHPAVAECAVFGIPDERWGEAVHAVVVRKPAHDSVDEDQLINFVRERLAKYKAPRSVEFIDELPKTGSGKIYKKELREKYWAGRVKQVN